VVGRLWIVQTRRVREYQPRDEDEGEGEGGSGGA
jgi:hypothetical protein